MKDYKIVLMMTEECLVGREYMMRLMKEGIPIDTIIFEKSELATANKTYLANPWYEPPTVEEMIWEAEGTKLCYVSHSNNDRCHELLQSIDPDLIILGGMRILKQRILDTAKVGVLNVHPGILPKYRGDDIVAWQIFNEDPVGVTCHFAVADVDAGAILLQKHLEYDGGPLAKVRMEAMVLSGDMLIEVIKNLDTIVPESQDENKANLWHEMDDEKRKVVEEILNEL